MATSKDKVKNVDLRRAGVEIVIPDGMTIPSAITWLQRIYEQEETYIEMDRTFPCFPFDGAVAFTKAVSQMFGFSFPSHVSQVKVVTGPGDSDFVLVPWGQIEIPGINGQLATRIGHTQPLVGFPPMPMFNAYAYVKQKEREKVNALFDLVEQIVSRESIYKGKALRVNIPKNKLEATPDNMPQFLDTRSTDPSKLIFTREIQSALEVNLFTILRNHNLLRSLGKNLKRGALLAGAYGTGKSETGRVVAKIGSENGWTFIEIPDSNQLKQALLFVKAYKLEPAILFVEDGDAAIGAERTDAVNDILNTLDGVVSKGSEIITIMTTNHPEKINPAALRRGRLDFKIMFEAPDAEAVVRLMRSYGAKSIRSVTHRGLAQAARLLAGRVPADARETISRAEFMAIDRINRAGRPVTEDSLLVSDEDLISAAEAVLNESRFTGTHKEPVELPEALVSLAGAFTNGISTLVDRLRSNLDARSDVSTKPSASNGEKAHGVGNGSGQPSLPWPIPSDETLLSRGDELSSPVSDSGSTSSMPFDTATEGRAQALAQSDPPDSDKGELSAQSGIE